MIGFIGTCQAPTEKASQYDLVFMTRFLVVGGAHIDRRARISGTTIAGASNPGKWQDEPGGGGFNAARNLAALGNLVTMVCVRGGDATGQLVENAAEIAGINDLAQVFLDRATPSYSAILEHSGDLVIAVADMELYDLFSRRMLSRKSIRHAIADCDAILCDANLPADTLLALSESAVRENKPLAAIAISPAKVGRLAGTFEHLTALFLNRAEAAAVCGETVPSDLWPQGLRAQGIKRAVITRGAQPVLGFEENRIFEISPPEIEALVDVTGAGDALAAATMHAMANGSDFCDAVRFGIAAARITVQSPHASPPDLNRQTLHAAFELVPEAVFLS